MQQARLRKIKAVHFSHICNPDWTLNVSIEDIEVMRGTIWESGKDQWEEEAGQRSTMGAYIDVYMWKCQINIY